MADRYWVGGTATWDGTAGTKWATTSSGAGGASVPGTGDNVFFDAASGAVTVTVGGQVGTFASITFTGFTGTFTGTSSLSVSGNFTLVAGMTYTYTGLLTITGTCALTTAGKSFSSITLSTAANVTLRDALTALDSTRALTHSVGTLNTNDQTVTFGSFPSTGTGTRTLTLGSSSIVLTSNSGWAYRFGNLTVTANTATVTLTAASAPFDGGNPNCGGDYNGLSVVLSGSGNAQIGNSAGVITTTLANVTRTGTAVKTDALVIGNHLVVTGTFTANGNSATNRLFVIASPAGSARTITAAAVSASNVDFQDITGAGAASWNLSSITGLSGDAGGNSGITFTTPVTVYKLAAGTSWDTASGWSLSSGGAANGRVPLPQDTARLDAATTTGASAAPAASGRYGSLDMTGFTGTWNANNTVTWYGSVTIGSGMTVAGTGTQTLAGRGSHTITTNGKTVTFGVTVAAVTGTYTLQDALTSNRSASGAITVTSGTLNTNGQTVTVSGTSGSINITGGTATFGSSTVALSGASSFLNNSSAATLNFGTSTWVLSYTGSGTPWTVISSSAVIGAPDVTLAAATTNTRTFAGGSQRYGTLTYTVADSPGSLTITGNNQFAALNVGPGRQLTLPANGTTNVAAMSASGEDRDYVYSGGASGDYISTPDHASLDGFTDVEVVLLVTPNTYAPGSNNIYAAKGTTWRVGLTTTGRLTFSANGTTAANSDGWTPPAIGTPIWLKWTYASGGSGTVTYYQADYVGSNVEPASWTQIGAAKTHGGGAIGAGADPLHLGASSPAGTNNLGGAYRRLIVRNAIVGSVVADFDASAHVTGNNTYTDSTGKVWTFNGTTAVGDGRVQIVSSTPGTPTYLAASMVESTGKPVYFSGDARTAEDAVALGYMTLDGTGDWARIPYDASFDIAGDMEAIVRAYMPDVTPTNQQPFMKRYNGASARGLGFGVVSGSSGQLFTEFPTGPASDSAATSSPSNLTTNGIADGSVFWAKFDWRNSDDRLRFWTAADGGSNVEPTFTQLGADKVGGATYAPGLALPNGFGIGAAFDGAFISTGRIYRAAWRNGIGGTAVFDADFTDAPPTMALDYLRLQDVKATGHGLWYAGSNSVDVSGNDYWSFADPVTSNTFSWDGDSWEPMSLSARVGGAWVEAVIVPG